MSIIFSRQVVPADAQHFLKHAGPVYQWMNAGSSTVSPVHGHFLHAEPKFARQEKNFRIEAPALDALQRQNRLHRAPRECLEAALRIFESQPKDEIGRASCKERV